MPLLIKFNMNGIQNVLYVLPFPAAFTVSGSALSKQMPVTYNALLPLNLTKAFCLVRRDC